MSETSNELKKLYGIIIIIIYLQQLACSANGYLNSKPLTNAPFQISQCIIYQISDKNLLKKFDTKKFCLKTLPLY